MSTVLACLPQGARVAVIRLRSLGDCVLTTPALDILHRARPDLRLAVVVEDRFRAVFEGNPAVAALLPPAAAEVRAWRPELVLNLHGGSDQRPPDGLCRRALAGRFRPFPLSAFCITSTFPARSRSWTSSGTVHTAEHLASAMFYLGAPAGEIPRARLFSEPPPPSRPYAVIHPVASAPGKTWPAAGFLAVAEHLRNALDLEPVFIGGPADDLAPFAAIPHPARRAAGRGETSALRARRCSWATIPARPTWRPRSACRWWCSSAPPTPTVWHPWKTAAEVIRNTGGIASIAPEHVLAALDRLRVRA